MTQCLPARVTTDVVTAVDVLPFGHYVSFDDEDCLRKTRAEARHWLIKKLHAPEELAEDVLLVVSELATNVTVHTTSRVALLFLYAESDGVLIRVIDFGRPRVLDAVPALCDAGSAQEGGRGMVLVDALSAYWKVAPNSDGSGTTYIAKIAIDA